MYAQQIPPVLEALIRQMHDEAQPRQSRENIANRIEDVATALMKEVNTFRGRPIKRKRA